MPAPAAAVVLTAALLPVATAELAAADKTMAALIAALPPPSPPRRQPPFHVLTSSIVNQQLSQKSAAAILRRIAEVTPPPFSADKMLELPPQKLRAAGLSAPKIRYIHELARAAEGGIFANIRRLPDEEILTRLQVVPGVGKWTAEMFLMFGLNRADVLSLGDGGLRRAARQLYGARFAGDDAQVLEKAAKKWHPWRTVACRYLWKSLDSPSPVASASAAKRRK